MLCVRSIARRLTIMEREAGYRSVVTIMLVLLLLAPCPSSALEEGDDIACLREFKESVTDPLGYLKNWDFRGRNINICNFMGVTCLRPDEPKVHKLDLAAAALGGRFPRGLGKCSSLTELNLSNNFFTGRVPATVCSTSRKLVSLDLSNNAFSGPVPSSIQRCLDSNKRFRRDRPYTELDEDTDMNYDLSSMIQMPSNSKEAEHSDHEY